MLTLGTLGDTAVNGLQEELPDGIHLRWSFAPEKGFPWFGYYLFRRLSQDGEKARHCIGRDLGQRKSGMSSASGMALTFGSLESDLPLTFTDEFPAAGQADIELSDRTYLRYLPPQPEEICWAEATIGFHKEHAGERSCIDFRKEQRGTAQNPLERDGVRITAFDSEGKQLPSGQFGMVAGHVGLDTGHGSTVGLPCPASDVTVALVSGAKPSKIEALDIRGRVVDTAGMVGSGPQEVTLAGSAIASVRIEAPENETLILGVCWTCKRKDDRPDEGRKRKSGVTIKGFYRGGLMTAKRAVGAPGDTVTVRLEADAIDRIEIGNGPAVLIDLCVVSVRSALRAGRPWDLLQDFEYPMSLPVDHPDYPCPGKPATDAEADARGLGRIVYGPSAPWSGAPLDDLQQQVRHLVEHGPPPAGSAMHQRATPVAGAPGAAAASGGTIQQRQQRPLDLLLLGSLQPPVAQMLGLYWYDKTAVPGTAYDYLLVADHDGSLGGTAASGLAWVNGVLDFSVVDGFLALQRTVAPAAPLAPPQDLAAYALPGSTVASGGGVIDATNNAGLSWERQLVSGILATNAPVLYHVWRADLGNDKDPPAPADSDFAALTKGSPLPVGTSIVSPPQIAPQPDEWPPFPLNFIDRALPEGWYSYRVNGVDLFGRHSTASLSCEWRQWTPAANPKPWYWQDPPAGPVVDPGRIRLLDKIPPPPPSGVEAFALDPADPTVLKDAAWQAWHASLSAAEKESVIGLRVRWRWDLAQQCQAPDTREFRVYFHPAPVNTLRARVTDVVAAGATESDVVTDIAHGEPANAFAGLSVRIGANSFRILSSGVASPLRFRVSNIGPSDDVRPAARTRCAITLQPGAAQYRDFSASTAWQDRILNVALNEHVTVDGTSRIYEVLLPVAGSADRTGLPLSVTLAEPMSAGIIGVSAADNRPHTDDARGDPARFGNESRIGGPATVFRVLREKPPAPAMPPDSDKAWASKADYHGRSYYTFRWLPAAGLKTFVYRAMDDAVIKADLDLRPRAPLSSRDLQFFPDEGTEPAWDALKRQQVSADLNALNAVDAMDPAAVRAAYAGLSNDALRILAALPGMDRAFAQLTHLPLDPAEPKAAAPDGLRWRRVGPDVAPGSLSAGLRAFVDTLDGKARNRYFYRCAYVDEVQNVGAMGLSSPPVWLPYVTAPVAPRISRLQAGDRQIVLEWASNREPDLAEYRIYRAMTREASQDIRLMDLVHSVVVAAGDPAARPKTLSWTDNPVPGLRDIWYRIVAVDRVDPDPKGGGGNVSAPSAAMRGRAFDQSPPVAPAFTTAEWVRLDDAGSVHAWTDPVPAGQTWVPAVRLEWPAAADGVRLIVQRKGAFDGGFSAVSGWLDPGTTSFVHASDRSSETTTYRLKVLSTAGNANSDFNPTTIPVPA